MPDLDVMHVAVSERETGGLPRFQELLAVCEAAQVVPVGQMGDQSLELTFRVIKGPLAGRRILQYITVWSHDLNTSVKGRTAFGVLCRALGIAWPSDSSEFRGRLVILRLTRKTVSEDKPLADYAACSKADRQAWEESQVQARQQGDEEAGTEG